MTSNDPLKDLPSGVSSDDVNDFCNAASDGDLLKVKSYIDKYGPGIINQRDRIDARAITWAAFNGHLDVVVYLVEQHADINAPGTDDRNALNWAAGMGRGDVVQYLLEKGASLDQKDNFNRTALEIAQEVGRDDIVEIIERHMDKRRKEEEQAALIALREQQKIISQTVENSISRMKKFKAPKLK